MERTANVPRNHPKVLALVRRAISATHARGRRATTREHRSRVLDTERPRGATSRKGIVADLHKESSASSTWTGAAIGAARAGFGIIWAVDAYLAWRPEFAAHYVGYLQNAATSQPSWLKGWFALWLGIVSAATPLFVSLTRTFETLLAAALLAGFARGATYLLGAVFCTSSTRGPISRAPSTSSAASSRACTRTATPPTSSRACPRTRSLRARAPCSTSSSRSQASTRSWITACATWRSGRSGCSTLDPDGRAWIDRT